MQKQTSSDFIIGSTHIHLQLTKHVLEHSSLLNLVAVHISAVLLMVSTRSQISPLASQLPVYTWKDRDLQQASHLCRQQRRGLEITNQVSLFPSPYSFHGPTSPSNRGLFCSALRTRGWKVPEQPKLSIAFSGSEVSTEEAGNLGAVL